MFVVEISFNKTGQSSELLYVRRPHFTIGADLSAHVVVEEMASTGYFLHFVKEKGSSFSCYSILSTKDSEQLEERFYSSTKMNLGDISLFVMTIDNDLMFRQIDLNPKNILRNLRKAVLSSVPVVPAIIIFHEKPVVYSIEPATEILLGRSKDCHIRIDAEGIEAIHCKIMYENLKFLIEDMMSQNGVFIDGERISSKTLVNPCQLVSLGGGINIMGINSENQVDLVNKKSPQNVIEKVEGDIKYPILFSTSSLVVPSKVQISTGKEILLGRSLENDVRIASPHVSRIHLKVVCNLKSEITVIDNSSNGSVCDGMLIGNGESMQLSKGPHIIDLGDSIKIGICCSKEDEELFLHAGNSVKNFLFLLDSVEKNKKKEKFFSIKILNSLKNFMHNVVVFYISLDKKGRIGFLTVCFFIFVITLLLINLLLGAIN